MPLALYDNLVSSKKDLSSNTKLLWRFCTRIISFKRLSSPIHILPHLPQLNAFMSQQERPEVISRYDHTFSHFDSGAPLNMHNLVSNGFADIQQFLNMSRLQDGRVLLDLLWSCVDYLTRLCHNVSSLIFQCSYVTIELKYQLYF